MTFANNLDSDEIQQNVGPHLRPELSDTQIIYQQNCWWKQYFYQILERQMQGKIYLA